MAELPERLYRSDQEVYLRKFVEEGEIFFRPLTYFRAVEDNVGRRDEFEGKFQQSAAGLSLSVDFRGTGDFSNSIQMETGSISFGSIQVENIHIYCFSTKPKMAFGPATVEVFDVNGLLTHLADGLASSNAELMFGLVDYYDPGQKLADGPVREIWRKKRSSFSEQDEFRIAFFMEDRRDFYARSFPDTYGKPSDAIPEHMKIRFGNLQQFVRLLPFHSSDRQEYMPT